MNSLVFINRFKFFQEFLKFLKIPFSKGIQGVNHKAVSLAHFFKISKKNFKNVKKIKKCHLNSEKSNEYI